jgi:aspartate/methionine/tyrosine aminotransferase
MFADRTKWNLAPNRLSEALARHRAAGKPLVDLTASNPTECGFAYNESAILEALGNPAALKYEPEPRGLASARQAVCAYYAEHGARAGIDDILLTTSTSEAYSYVLRLLCNPGDEVLIPAPSYPLFDFLAEIQDTKLVRYPLIYDHGWQIDFHALEYAITPRTRAIVVVHPNNPTGHFSKGADMERLNALASAGGLALVVDEVFLDFSMQESRPASFACDQDSLTFTMSGLSKICGLPQMKVAWLVTSGPGRPKREALKRLEVIADTYLSLNAPVQLAMPAFLSQRRGFQEQLMARVRRNLAELDRQLAFEKPCSRLEVEGGWYAVLRVPATCSDEDHALSLLNEWSVYVHPGHLYDFSSEGYFVVSLISKEEEFSLGVKRILERFRASPR